MKKYTIIILSIIGIAIVAGIGLYYYYYHVEKVNDYILITYTPPQKEASMYGGYRYSEPKVEYKLLEEYASDENAIKEQEEHAKSTKEFCLEKIEELSESPTSDRVDKFALTCQIEAYQAIMSREYILIRISHNRNFNPENELNIIGEHWKANTFIDYMNDKNIDYAIYIIN